MTEIRYLNSSVEEIAALKDAYIAFIQGFSGWSEDRIAHCPGLSDKIARAHQRLGNTIDTLRERGYV